MRTNDFVYDSVILGEGCVYSTDCEATQLNNNVLVCGGSGSGKSATSSAFKNRMDNKDAESWLI